MAGDLRRHRIVAVSTKWMTAAEPTRTEPRAAEKTMPRDRLGGVIRTRRHESTGPGEPGRKNDLIAADQREGQARGPTGRPGAGGCRIHARDWSRAHREIRGVEQRRCRRRLRACDDGIPRESDAWHGCELLRRRFSASPQSQAAHGETHSASRTSSSTGR